jgi:hypothetical protein
VKPPNTLLLAMMILVMMKINELIDALNEKDRLLEKQEDILYEEHDKFISVQKPLALEIKRNEMLSESRLEGGWIGET